MESKFTLGGCEMPLGPAIISVLIVFGIVYVIMRAVRKSN